jgi:hypothetical protein
MQLLEQIEPRHPPRCGPMPHAVDQQRQLPHVLVTVEADAVAEHGRAPTHPQQGGKARVEPDHEVRRFAHESRTIIVSGMMFEDFPGWPSA